MALSKADTKRIRSLQRKKFRQKYNNFVVEGDKMAVELLRQRPGEVEAVYALSGWLAEQAPGRYLPAGKIHEVTYEELKKISGLTTPNQVLAVVRIPAGRPDPAFLQQDYGLYLDGIRDPGNMGAILRIADWFGIRGVFCSEDCVDVYNPKVIQASMGAFMRVSSACRAVADIRKQYPGLPLLGAVLDGESVFECTVPANGLIVIGSEAQGISADLIPGLTHRLSIPAGPGGGAESLNAAVAAGILAAVLRHRQQSGQPV